MNPDFNFGRGKARHALALGDLERNVLETLWDTGEISGKDIFDRVGASLNVQHNTILTVLDRLIKKGLVSKEKGGRGNMYRAKVTRDEFARMVSSPIIEELMHVSPHVAMSALVESASNDPDKLNELKKMIEEAEKRRNEENKEKKNK
ncbi:MAG: BlaI/MecI/CopY family transcriptional regulator [bacterium]|nr:BlaI/MecI/CopY family transcriptional regulator [bacterium]